jgi:hypothetical protein
MTKHKIFFNCSYIHNIGDKMTIDEIMDDIVKQTSEKLQIPESEVREVLDIVFHGKSGSNIIEEIFNISNELHCSPKTFARVFKAKQINLSLKTEVSFLSIEPYLHFTHRLDEDEILPSVGDKIQFQNKKYKVVNRVFKYPEGHSMADPGLYISIYLEKDED